MRIMVTGGAGFLGSHLIDRLLADGHEVVCLDNLSTGRLENLAEAGRSGRFTFIEGDVVEPFPPAGRFDRVFHLASPVTQHAVRPIATLRAGAEGTRHALDLAEQCGAVCLIASTSEVYGNPQTHPQTESYAGCVSPVGPRSAYSEAKRFAESLATAYARQRGLRVRIARIFNTYGPRMRPDDGRVIPTFIVQALAGRPLTVFGSGRQTRSFCYVSDTVDAMVRLAEAEYTGPVNVGHTDEVAIADLAEEIIELSGSDSRIEFRPPLADDPHRRRPDVSLAARLLGWTPTVGRREGLTRTIAYYGAQEGYG